MIIVELAPSPLLQVSSLLDCFAAMCCTQHASTQLVLILCPTLAPGLRLSDVQSVGPRRQLIRVIALNHLVRLRQCFLYTGERASRPSRA